jgi:hypothetical protein
VRSKNAANGIVIGCRELEVAPIMAVEVALYFVPMRIQDAQDFVNSFDVIHGTES